MYEKNHVLNDYLPAFFCSILDGENIFKHLLLIAEMLKVCTKKPILVQKYWPYSTREYTITGQKMRMYFMWMRISVQNVFHKLINWMPKDFWAAYHSVTQVCFIQNWLTIVFPPVKFCLARDITCLQTWNVNFCVVKHKVSKLQTHKRLAVNYPRVLKISF
jgi:hypothetical protein